MMKLTHLAFSLFLGLLVLPDRPLLIAAFLLGSFVPDIDTATSFLGKRIRAIGWLFLHRGIFHSLVMLVMLSAIVFVFSNEAGIAFGLGFAGHLALDSLNPAGVRWLFPMKSRLRGFVVTGGIGEGLVFLVSLGGCAFLLLR